MLVRGRGRHVWAYRLGAVALIALATCAVAEIALRFTKYARMVPFDSRMPQGYYAYNMDGTYDHVLDFPISKHGFSDYEYDIWTNNIGCFDRDIVPGEPYILLIGDSFTWGFAPFEDKWGTRIEEMLGVRVAKCGVTGYGTADALRKARQVVGALGAPELIIVGYAPDDAFNDSSPRALPAGARSWTSAVDQYLRNRSVLYMLGRQQVLRIQRSRVSAGVARAAPGEWPEVHAENIEALAEFAKRHGTEAVFVLIPAKQELRSTFSERQSKLIAQFEARNIASVNVLDALRHYEQLSGKPLYWDLDPHWNREGNRLVGYEVAEYLLENDLVDVTERDRRLDELKRMRDEEFPR